MPLPDTSHRERGSMHRRMQACRHACRSRQASCRAASRICTHQLEHKGAVASEDIEQLHFSSSLLGNRGRPVVVISRRARARILSLLSLVRGWRGGGAIFTHRDQLVPRSGWLPPLGSLRRPHPANSHVAGCLACRAVSCRDTSLDSGCSKDQWRAAGNAPPDLHLGACSGLWALRLTAAQARGHHWHGCSHATSPGSG
jgi:hypothetical protein